MENEQTVASPLDGGDPTEQEALLASQVDTIGDNPTEEPAADPAPAKTDAAAAETDAVPEAATAAAAPAADSPAAVDTVAAPAPAAAAPAPTHIAPAAVPPPTAPMDFDTVLAENQRKYDAGEIDQDEFQKVFRDTTKAEAQFSAKVEIWADKQQSAADTAAQAFNTVALQWEQANAEFMSNPLRAANMQAAIAAVDAKTPGLSPEQLFDAASKIAFEAYSWKIQPAVGVDAAKIAAAAVAQRQPGAVPPTLASSPAAAPIEAAANNSTFSALDTLGISELEDATARMTPQQRDAWLRDSPGSNSPATNRAISG